MKTQNYNTLGKCECCHADLRADNLMIVDGDLCDSTTAHISLIFDVESFVFYESREPGQWCTTCLEKLSNDIMARLKFYGWFVVRENPDDNCCTHCGKVRPDNANSINFNHFQVNRQFHNSFAVKLCAKCVEDFSQSVINFLVGIFTNEKFLESSIERILKKHRINLDDARLKVTRVIVHGENKVQ